MSRNVPHSLVVYMTDQPSLLGSFVLMVHQTQSRQKYQLFETQKRTDKKRDEIKS